ncbi:hypothetical protein ONZ45_g2801 [Pleurotus djamor]|nr:hypothetical protein ONZ45_g2801 [Pleurotus djamor]
MPPFTSVSPVRPTSRSLTLTSGIPQRNTQRIPSFEPRIVRGDSSSRTQPDVVCLPSSSTSVSVPSSRTRRTSGTGVRAPSAQRGPSAVPHSVGSSSEPSNIPSTSSASGFPRPAYLEHSALRHLLRTEEPPQLPARKVDTPAGSGFGVGSNERASPSMDSDDDGTGTPPRAMSASPRATSRSRSAIKPAAITHAILPSRWSEEHRHQSLSVSSDGRELTFQANSLNGEKDSAAARTIHPAPAACGIYYYEVEVLTMRAFSGPDIKLNRLPGWERNSWGYHGHDGYTYASDREGQTFDAAFQTGDIIGCGIDFTTRRMFYTRNGSFINHAFDNVGKDGDIYPAVGMRHSGESLRVNFGQDPFKFDIEYHIQQQRSTVWNSILMTPISGQVVEGRPGEVSEEQAKGRINKLILSYLAHHGYARTARAFQMQIAHAREGISGDADVEMEGTGVDEALEKEIEQRTHVVHAVMDGDIDNAIEETKRCYKEVLEMDNGLVLFKLKCRKFVELVMTATEMKDKMGNGADDDGMIMDVDEDSHLANGEAVAAYERTLTDAIAYGQTLNNEFRDDKRPEVQEILKRTFGILAFYDPRKASGSTPDVVGKDSRLELASEVNQAILKSQGKPTQPILETVYRHTAGCITQLGLLGVGSAAFADLQKELLE